jgi:acyl-coenzyme A synthetase/AMP-(fatty) acid ligase
MRYLLRNIKVKPVRFFLSKRFIQSSSSVGSNNIHQYERNELIDDTMKARTHKNLSYSSTTSDYHLVPDTIKELIDKRSEDSADKLVYGFPHQGGRNLTFGELKQRVNTISQNMLKMGLNKGDRIALALPNTIELVCSFLAASEIGLVSVLLNPAYQLVEFEYMLKKTGAKALVIYDSFRVLNHMELMKKICPEIESSSPGELKSQRLPDLKHIFVLNSPLVPEKKTYKGTWSFDTLVKPSNGVVEYPYVDIDDPCLILFTSGTTGKTNKASSLILFSTI